MDIFNTDLSFSFANSAPVDTPTVFNMDSPSRETFSGEDGQIIVSNPSTVTDITVRLYVSRTLNSVERWGLLAIFSVPKSTDTFNPDQVNKISATAVNVRGLFSGDRFSVVCSNNTVLGGSDAFIAYAKLATLK